jgi:Fe-S cluster assembly protein SufB
VRDISSKKNEPDWMLQMRLKGLRLFEKKPMPTWGSNLNGIDFDNIKYFVRSTEKQAASWDDLPDDIKQHVRPPGHPRGGEAAPGVGRGCPVRVRGGLPPIARDLEAQGVIFLDTDTGLKEHPETSSRVLRHRHPPGDNKFAALNTAVWSGGSFVYVPKGVHVDIPLQAYFRINTENMGQFERTLIIVDEAPTFTTSRAARRRSTSPTRCTRRSSRSS